MARIRKGFFEGAAVASQKQAISRDLSQKYWVSGLCPSSGIQNTRKHNVSETGFVSVLR
jgi:hypothetical protein